MADIPQLVSSFVGPIALIMALVMMFSLTHRSHQKPLQNNWLMAGMFSAALALSMSDPIELGTIGIFDMRNLLVGTAAAILGPKVALLVVATAAAFRLGIGGNGMWPGIVAIGLSYVGGLGWRTFAPTSIQSTPLGSIGLGFAISLHLFAIFLLPMAAWGAVFSTMAPYMFATNLIGALLLNYLLSSEMNYLRETETLRLAARTDHMTGLLNRRGLQESYSDVQSSGSEGQGIAVLYFDIDNFKTFNDRHGHSLGDTILRFVADRVQSNLRPGDLFSRLGGDEFAVVLGNITEANARVTAERCRKVVADSSFRIEGEDVSVSISLGAIWMIEKDNMELLLDTADRALYRAKQQGRNRVVFESQAAA